MTSKKPDDERADQRFVILLTPPDREALDELAIRTDRSRCDVVRRLIRHAADSPAAQSDNGD